MLLFDCTGFDWDAANSLKNEEKHGVSPAECEEIFFNVPFVVADDVRHSAEEKRWFALGMTDAGRRLFVVFTVRRKSIRIISARDMSRRERKEYEAY